MGLAHPQHRGAGAGPSHTASRGATKEIRHRSGMERMMRPRWANTTERASFNTDDVTRLLLMVSEKISEAPWDDEPAKAHRAAWENIGAQIEALLHYSVCCECLALVHKEDRDIHPCGPHTCTEPVVRSEGHPHPDQEARAAARRADPSWILVEDEWSHLLGPTWARVDDNEQAVGRG